MKYQSTCELAERVCDRIGWWYKTRPIAVCQRGGTVYVTGTVLKPEEWRSLLSWDGSVIDGKTIRVTRVPSRL